MGGKVEGFEVLAAPLKLPWQVALSRCLCRPRPSRQHLHTTVTTLRFMHAALLLHCHQDGAVQKENTSAKVGMPLSLACNDMIVISSK